MPRDYSEYDLDEPRRILMLNESGETINIIWASINFCLWYFADESMWAIEPPPEPEVPPGNVGLV